MEATLTCVGYVVVHIMMSYPDLGRRVFAAVETVCFACWPFLSPPLFSSPIQGSFN